MDIDLQTNDTDVGTIDFKAKVLEIYPNAYCFKHSRHHYFFALGDGSYGNAVRYDHDIVTDTTNGDKISTSKYTEGGAWEYAWYYIERETLKILER